MRVNLSSNPVVLQPGGLARGLSEAFAKVAALTGIAIGPPLPEVVDECCVDAELQNLVTMSSTQGPAQSAAAAALLSLALEGHVMLPAVGPSLFAIAPPDYALELSSFLRQVDDWVRGQKPRWWPKRSHLQLLLATDCRQAGGFSIHDFAQLHGWLMHEHSVDSKFSLSAPEYLLLRGLEMADAATLGRDLRHGYIIWRASDSDKTMGFEEFMADPKNMAGMRIHGHERERIELQHHIELRQAKYNKRKEAERASRSYSPYVEGLHRIARSDAATSPEDYFAELRGGSNVKGFRPDGWLYQPINYPGRPTVEVAKLGDKWFTAFRAFLAHRRKDYETDKQVRSALAVLADYLLLYLPWWMELHPQTTLEYPSSPKQFLRYFYVDRTRFHSEEAAELANLPKTLNELLPLRRPTPGSRNTARLTMEQFFNFVFTYFEDNEAFVSRGMQNPIRTDFDNEVAGRRTKTNKVPFAEDVFPFLVHYGQAVEAFGEFLQQEAYIRNCFRELPNGPSDGYKTSEWGYVPLFWYRGRLYNLDWLPNIFLISKRTLQSNPKGQSGLYVHGQRINSGPSRNVTLNFPHLTVVRLLVSMVETGLRGQSVQWLDRRSFDQLAPPVSTLADLHGNPQGQNYHALYINTDKTHEEWRNLVSWRVRRSLIAERHFQESVVDGFVGQEVDYEDREHSRFLPVLALFRSDRAPKPVSDSLYSSRWVEFLYGFECFYNIRDGVDLSDSDDALTVLREREDYEEGAGLSDMYLAIHTPHACRATYATLKDGDLEVAEIAEQLGQANTVVTGTYQVPQMKRLLAKLKAIDERTLVAEPFDPASDNAAALHPDRQGSAVRVAFDKSRDQAISDFGFVPGVALWSLSELDGDASALELLRQSPSSLIRWHPTHVCPVGNQCPREVVANTGAMNRCGMCPLAAKCIDHLPAIEAKQRELLERIRATTVRQEGLVSRGASQTELDTLHREKSLDTKEFLGWKLSAEIVRARQRALGEDSKVYHIDQPELVKKQLELVTRNRTESEFFLQRIADSNTYPSLESQEVRAKALRYTRLILAQQDRLKEAAFLDVPPHSETTVFASLLKPFIEAKGLSLQDLGSALDEMSRLAALPASSATPLLAGV